METIPTDAELRENVEKILVTKPELEHDPEALIYELNADRIFKWKIMIEQIQNVVKSIQSEREPQMNKPKELFEFDFSSAVSASIERGAHHWNETEIEGIHHAQGGLGSKGVFLLKLKGKGVIVLKQKSLDVERDYFASEFLRSLGINAPEMRVLAKHELKDLSDKARNAPVTVKDTCKEINGQQMRNEGAILIEYLPGLELSSPLLKLTSNETKHLLKELGKILAADMLINNTDRMPFMRRGDGNPGNVLVATKPEFQVFAIDQAVAPVEDETNFADYISKLNNLDVEFGKIYDFLQTSLAYPETLPVEKVTLDTIKNAFAHTLKDKQLILAKLDKAIAETKRVFPEFDRNELVRKMVQDLMKNYVQ